MNTSVFNNCFWPLPAFLTWAACWISFSMFQEFGAGLITALLVSVLLGVVGSLWGRTRTRRILMAFGFPLSWWALRGSVGMMASLPAWAWLLPLGAALLLYPPATWRDAPLFPTPPRAFDGLAKQVPLPLAGHVLDAGCGLGNGLLALERAYPEVHLHGLENSWPLRVVAALHARHADVRQGDMWTHDWSRYNMVYLFQRPESMSRAWGKACGDMVPGSWLASLEFPVPDVVPTLIWTCPDGRPLWLYQMADDDAAPAIQLD